jgi:hypothetical protein
MVFSSMIIQIHPEAARRFNELADQILTKITFKLEASGQVKEFRPDIYPVAQIPERETIGEISVMDSLVDTTGKERGRFFEHEKRNMGLVGESFESLSQLVRRLHDTPDLKETTSHEFILDTAFEWIEGKHKNTQCSTFTEYVLKRSNDEIRDFEVWFPVYRTYLESSFPMGRVVFQTISRQMMDECEARIPKSDPETAIAVQSAFARDRSVLQACAAAGTKIRAERTKALATSRELAEDAVGLLRFFSPANWTPKLRSYCTLLGSENVRGTAELFLHGTSVETYHRGALDSGAFWVLSNSYLSNFPGLLDRLQTLAAAPDYSPFRQAIYDALLVYSRNSVAITPTDKLVYILVALESLLVRGENEPLAKNVGERFAFLIGESKETRIAVRDNTTEIYRHRSGFLHHGRSVKDLDVSGRRGRFCFRASEKRERHIPHPRPTMLSRVFPQRHRTWAIPHCIPLSLRCTSGPRSNEVYTLLLLTCDF